MMSRRNGILSRPSVRRLSLSGNQSRNQSSAPGYSRGQNVFMSRVRAIAVNSQTIQHGDSHRREKISVGSAAHLRFSQLEA